MSSPETARESALARITQKTGLLSQRTLTLFPDRLEVQQLALSKRSRCAIPLLGLKDEPDLKFITALTAFVLGVALAVVWFIFLLPLLAERVEGRRDFIIAVTVVFGVPALIGLGFGIRGLVEGRAHVLHYETDRNGKSVPGIWLHAARPSRREVDDFVRAYRDARRAAGERQEQEPVIQALGCPSQAEAVEQFARLRAEGILTEEEFAMVKASLLRTDRGPIGFK